MKKYLQIFRWTAFVGIFCWAVLIASAIRSWGPGPKPHVSLIAALIGAGPIAGLAFIGLPKKRYFLVVAGLIFGASSIAEVYAVIEEQWFLYQHKGLPQSAEIVFQDRWWPNGSSYLYYDPATGKLGGGD